MHAFLATLTAVALAATASAADAVRLELVGLPESFTVRGEVAFPSLGFRDDTTESYTWERKGRMSITWNHDADPAAAVGLIYGAGLSSSGFEDKLDGNRLRQSVLGVQGYVGIAAHPTTWLAIEAAPYVGLGVSAVKTDYQDTSVVEREEYDPGLATEFGLRAAAVVTITPHWEAGLVMGWMRQRARNEGQIRVLGVDGDVTMTTVTKGGYGGILVGYRF